MNPFIGCDPETGNQNTRELVYVYQTKRGDIVKIGHTRNLSNREFGLSYGWSGSTAPLGHSKRNGRMIACWPGSRDDERAAHEALRDSSIEGEWFAYDERVKTYIDEQIGGAT